MQGKFDGHDACVLGEAIPARFCQPVYSPRSAQPAPATRAAGARAVLRCFTCAAHAPANACRAESFVGSDAPVRATNVADQVFLDLSAVGKLNPSALQRLLTLYKSNTLESALNLVVLPACPPYAACPSGAHGRSLASRTKGWCRSWWHRVAAHCTWWRARATSHMCVSSTTAPARTTSIV